MVNSSIGLRGYIGEEIVFEWLSQQGKKVVRQVRPKGFPARGGPYLDFGVILENRLAEVYEVKTQDYALEKEAINKSLRYIWETAGVRTFLDQKGAEYPCENPDARIVLLVKPQKDLAIELERYDRVVYFDKIFRELDEEGEERVKRIIERANSEFRDAIGVLRHLARRKR
jgi:hypothetical protein